MIGWDDARTARAYEAFATAHPRYDEANRELVLEARIAPSHRVLDLAAGTGRTAEAALATLGQDGRVLCVEPARAMREAGKARVRDGRVAWTEAVGHAEGAFDRILCGAAIWQLSPLGATFTELRARLARGGLLVFDVPALYLGEPDDPGGGGDPLLLSLAAEIASGRVPRAAQSTEPPLSIERVESALAAAGLSAERFRFRTRLTQTALRDWMKIPVVNDALLGDLPVEERDARIDAAFARCDADSWRWERWVGWRAGVSSAS